MDSDQMSFWGFRLSAESEVVSVFLCCSGALSYRYTVSRFLRVSMRSCACVDKFDSI